MGYRESQMTKKHLKKCSTSLAIGEMQIKMSLGVHLTSVKMTKLKSTNNNLCWRVLEQGEHPSIVK